ncbi:MAG: tetratricopeptide repeat protein [Chitinivibrionia bacterium]|nr:tetratricopeptide repeat protein [Chitinivibrionia bacterium]
MLSLRRKDNFSFAVIAFIAVLLLTALSGCRSNAGHNLTPAEQAQKTQDSISFLELASEYFIEGNNALRLGDTLLALNFFETAFMLDTNSNFLRNRVIEVAIVSSVPESAVMVIQRGRPLSEVDDDELRQLTAIFLRFRAYPQAFEALSAIREKNRNDTIIIARMAMAENLIILGSLFNARSEHDSAIIAFNRVLDLGIKTTEVLFGLGVASERIGEFERAINYFKEVLAMNPRHPIAANNLAYMWAERGINLDEAMFLVRIALEDEPDNGAYLDTYGWILFNKGRYEEALPPLLRAAELLPEEYVVFYHIARTYLALGDKDNALKFFKFTNETFTDNPDFERIAEFISTLSE